MSLEAILDNIHAAGKEQILAIEQQTVSRIGGILANAHMDAHDIEQDAHRHKVAPALREKARILHQARLESLRMVGGIREELVDTAMTKVRDRLSKIRTQPQYRDVLSRLILEALAELKSHPGENVAILEADERDKKEIEGILSDLGIQLSVRYVLDCWGGIILKSEDEKVVAINLLETRMDRAATYLRGHLAAVFEKE